MTKCPYCGKDFKRINLHKCKMKPPDDAVEAPPDVQEEAQDAIKEDEIPAVKEETKPTKTSKEQKEIEIKEEIIASFEDDENFVLTDEMREKLKADRKFWQKPPFSLLLDPDLINDPEMLNQDFTPLIHKFFNEMLKEDLINFRISGMAILGAATLHHAKIKDVIEHEQKIQKEIEIEEMRERTRRAIPKALPQPIQPSKKIATKDDLFSAMRSAILETMQNREKLRRARERREEQKQIVQIKKSKAQLPKELLKHITGKEQTIEELIDGWYNKIKASIDLNDSDGISFDDLIKLIKTEYSDELSRKFSLVRMFLALMFLGTSKKINMFQAEDFENIDVMIE